MCQAALVGDQVVVAMTGISFCLGANNQITWLRLSPCIPPTRNPRPAEQYPQPPLVDGNRLYVTQCGVPAVECVDVATGRVFWKRGFAGLRRILDLSEGRILVETIDGVSAFQADSGRFLWHRDVLKMRHGYARPGPGLFVCAQIKWIEGGECPLLTWIDLATGKVKEEIPLTTLRSQRVTLGPMVMLKKRLWSFAEATGTPGEGNATRDLVELSPVK
jgi:hypothetical protein